MARPKSNPVHLTDEEAEKLKALIKKKGTNRTTAARCQILLAVDERHGKTMTYSECEGAFGVGRPTIARVAKAYAFGGVDAALRRKRGEGSDTGRIKMDGRAEARLIEVATGPAPDGHSRWTLVLM